MRTSIIQKTVALAIASLLATGCYSKKMMNFTYARLDTVQTTQRELLERLEELTRRFDESSEDGLRTRAETALALEELRVSIEILSSRIDDHAQLLTSGSPRAWQGTVPRFPPAKPDTLGRYGPDSTRVAPPSARDSESEKLFKSSYMDLTLGNYDLAVQGFKNFLVRYPGASNTPDAHYYLGEAYYALSRYLEAVGEYQMVIKEFPRSRFVPASYLKSGYCYQQLEETDLANKAFRELISLYPRSEEAEQARATLQDMGG